VIESWVVPSSAARAANQVASDCTCPRFESGTACGWVPIEQFLGALICGACFVHASEWSAADCRLLQSHMDLER
jgi:hypothetical protein